MPSKFFNCAPMIMIDVADVNALVTGTDIKSTRKPEMFVTQKKEKKERNSK